MADTSDDSLRRAEEIYQRLVRELRSDLEGQRQRLERARSREPSPVNAPRDERRPAGSLT